MNNRGSPYSTQWPNVKEGVGPRDMSPPRMEGHAITRVRGVKVYRSRSDRKKIEIMKEVDTAGRRERKGLMR